MNLKKDPDRIVYSFKVTRFFKNTGGWIHSTRKRYKAYRFRTIVRHLLGEFQNSVLKMNENQYYTSLLDKKFDRPGEMFCLNCRNWHRLKLRKATCQCSSTTCAECCIFCSGDKGPV